MTFLCISSSLQSTCELSFGYLLCPLKDLPTVASFSLLSFKCQCFQMYLSVLNIHQIHSKRYISYFGFLEPIASLQRHLNVKIHSSKLYFSHFNTVEFLMEKQVHENNKVANIFILNDANMAQMKYVSSFYISRATF